MKASKLLLLLATALVTGLAQAQAIRIAASDDVKLPESTVTRAEVIADYHMWRLAGLQDITASDRGPSREGVEYRTAFAKYQQLRASPQFALLVAELSRRPNATVVADRGVTSPLVFSAPR